MPQMNAAWKLQSSPGHDETAFDAAKRRAHRETRKILPRGWSMRIGGSRVKKPDGWHIFWSVKFETVVGSINGMLGNIESNLVHKDKSPMATYVEVDKKERRYNNKGVRIKISWFPCSQESPSNDDYWIATSGTSTAAVTHEDALNALKADIPSLKSCMDRIMHHLASDPISSLIYSATAKEPQ